EITASVPAAVPTVHVERGAQRLRVRTPALGAGLVAAFARELNERRQRRAQEPAEPDTFAAPQLADAVHAVVPVAGADQWQDVRGGTQAAVETAGAMFEQRRRFIGDLWLKERIVCAFAQPRPVEK